MRTPQIKLLNSTCVIHCSTNCQHKLCLDDTNFSRFWVLIYYYYYLLHWTENWSGCGHLLEYLESSGTKITIRGPIGKKEEHTVFLWDFSAAGFTLAKYLRHTWSLFTAISAGVII